MTDRSGPRPFDITDPLPTGTTVLEASAGTGKTYAIVAIAARFIAEGVDIDRLLLVTFSRAASAELRERMRERVSGLVDVLGDPDAAVRSPDALERYLATGTPDLVDARRERLAKALSDFDASTIATTHTFCNRMLEALGFLGEREMVTSIVEDVDDLVDEIARDRYLAGYAQRDTVDFEFAEAVRFAREAMRQPTVTLAPTAADLADGPQADAQVAARRVAFASRVRALVEQRKRVARLRTYDDLQGILHAVVTDPHDGDEASRRIRDSFDAVLVDEFQDTDPQQWDIVSRCFHGSTPLVLVGDPKQAIYGFRGAEVLSYLSAVATSDDVRVLDVNHRSDGAIVDALGGLYSEATLGHEQIVVHPVSAASPGSRLDGAPPVRLRAFLRNAFPTLNSFGFPSAADARERVIADVAADIAASLNSGATLTGSDGRARPVSPGDIAVLVRATKTIEPLQQALAERGVASVVRSGTSVFRTAGARHWLWVLRAIEAPARAGGVRLAALTPLIGWDTVRIAEAGDGEIAELAQRFVEWGQVLATTGFAAMAQRLMDHTAAAATILAGADGERALTDLLQIASLCNHRVVETGCGAAELAEWLDERIADEGSRYRAEDQSRRLDRDAQAVQIMTVHASKGLQFPIVYLPFAWNGMWMGDDATLSYHDSEGRRYLDVGGKRAPGRSRRRSRAIDESGAEELRLLYVALTRAQSQAVIWWAPVVDTARSPLHRLIFGRTDALAEAQERGTSHWTVPGEVEVPDDQTVAHGLMAWGRESGITVERADRQADEHWAQPADELASQTLSVATFGRTIDHGWRRTSYSAITAGAGHVAAPAVVLTGSEPDDEGWQPDEQEAAGPASPSAEAAVPPLVPGTPSLMNGMPFGAGFGLVVHEALEYVDTSAPDMHRHVRELCAEAVGSSAELDVDALTTALCAVLTTPLGFGDLWSIGPSDRLAELDFEFPLAGEPADGEVGESGGFLPAEVADLLDEHLAADDPLAGYAAELRTLPAQRYRGFLTGSIDSVLRTPDNTYVVVDYKTNRLREGLLNAEDFTTEAMAAEMIAAHYPLQALLYSVALHRYLRWRIAGYTPAMHLGGVQYHFVRGMVGPRTPPGCGVFEWRVPPALVIALSDLLAGGTR